MLQNSLKFLHFFYKTSLGEKEVRKKYFSKASEIKLIEKNNTNKRYIKNWRTISLLNLDTKILSKALSKKSK